MKIHFEADVSRGTWLEILRLSPGSVSLGLDSTNYFMMIMSVLIYKYEGVSSALWWTADQD